MDSTFTVTPRFAVKMLEKVLRLYTPSLSEKPVAEFLADKCDDLGFEDIHIDEVGNIIAKKGSGSPRILLCGHMDTVPGKIKVRKEGDNLFGRGASDAKAPLMAMLFAAASVQNNNGTVIFCGAVDEEGNATGIKNLVQQKLDLDYAVFGEPSGIRQVTIAYKGRLAINLKINVGDSAHASAPWLAKNAIEESAVFTQEVKRALEAGQDAKKKSMMLTATITEIKGGTSHNVTPKECETILDIRIPVDMNCKMVEEKIAKSVQEVSKKREVEAFYSILDETEPFEAPHNSPLVRAFTLGVMEVEHARPTLIRKTGTGDMNVIGNRMKIPVVTYGPGDPHQAHTIDEKVSIDEYLRGIEVLKKTLHHLKRLHDRKNQ
ncbi:MAG: M20/M25/M40 family metallo-hydrolase [Crenarchaeota archaeon]|nr:MAG: M20/M25/M40 family metallo-hydrolase [Thermoproteota archaeon]RDJ32971.1 MAG: M20/M25/M40 family metallo-hydrolase [Thermoproteota archaeon]RDJ36524.1 MAG: M20/M25/M40 family metallo-hydrolase [Thermoproteota archaeon]